MSNDSECEHFASANGRKEAPKVDQEENLKTAIPAGKTAIERPTPIQGITNEMMGKQTPTENFGLVVPSSEGDNRAWKMLECIRTAEEADPELKGEHERRDADSQAVYDRFGGRNFSEASSQEYLIRDARKYAESYLAEASTPEDRLKMTRMIWDHFIPKHPNREAFQLEFGALHNAVWTEGYPSLEERAHQAAKNGSLDGPMLRTDPTANSKLPPKQQAPAQLQKIAPGVAELSLVDLNAPIGSTLKETKHLLTALGAPTRKLMDPRILEAAEYKSRNPRCTYAETSIKFFETPGRADSIRYWVNKRKSGGSNK
jgi:hypothetical protein